MAIVYPNPVAELYKYLCKQLEKNEDWGLHYPEGVSYIDCHGVDLIDAMEQIGKRLDVTYSRSRGYRIKYTPEQKMGQQFTKEIMKNAEKSPLNNLKKHLTTG